ncbi:MAG: non-ribosomal peptide synthetase, partial [Chloroflexota bacterium]
GKPKGVMIPHQGLVNYLSWCSQAYQIAEGNGVPVHSSISFDLTITGLFGPLMVGQTAIMIPEAKGGEALGQTFTSPNNFSLIKITPAHLEVLSQQLSATFAQQTNYFIIGGEALWGENLAFWQKHAPDTKLINEYGPTETVVGCCVYEMSAAEAVAGAVPIGRPIANTQLYLLDSQLQPVPVGVVGELYIGGDSVSRGYFNRPGLTAEKFIPNPFDRDPTSSGSRLYKTGDNARYLPDGNLEFLGRIDQQVKVRGYRIELGEIESVLSEHPNVQDMAVLAREDRSGDKRLVAYIVSNEADHNKLHQQLREFLQTKLPNYMIPAHFITLPHLPLTHNGKVNRKALPVPNTDQMVSKEAYAAPRNPTEEILVDIWRDVLDVQKIGIDDNFFELGGHSLLATQLISRIHKIFKLEIPLPSLFEAPTIANLSETLIKYETKPGQVATIARLRKKLRGLSKAEMQAMLKEKRKK